MLDKGNLLSLIQTFSLFSTNDKGQIIKIVGRYQQFRAVKLAVKRLLEGQNPRERSGIIWHTQGSGKSLTMMFMVREMYRHPELASWKIIFITDRTQLEDQLNETSGSVGFTVNVANSIKNLKDLLKSDTSDLVMAMIHKFRETDLIEIFPELNKSHKILVMTDEAHRSQYKMLAANLDKAIPNASKIGYTGTPIDKTEKVFGDYIDKYTMRQSIEDGVTLEIVYEGRTHNAEVTDQKGMDDAFADVFSDFDITQRLEIIGYGTRNAYLEAESTIQAKAKDMVEHYLTHVYPNGYKAQVVATSREAAVRYKKHLDAAISEKIAEYGASNPERVSHSLTQVYPIGNNAQLFDASRGAEFQHETGPMVATSDRIAEFETLNPGRIDLEQLRKLQTDVIISGSHNDLPHLKEYSDKSRHERSIKSFKMDFGKEDEDIAGDMAILIVNNMLITGFDAPIEQVMYLDKVIRDHNLLQAIARVNRIGGETKNKGFVIDYVGIGHHLKDAISSYDEREQKEIIGTLSSSEREILELQSSFAEIMNLLKEHGLTDLADHDAFYDVFYDEEIRFEYMQAFRKVTQCLNLVYPSRKALDYINDYNAFVAINHLAGMHFRDGRLSMKGIPPKLRAITDKYLQSKGIEQKVKPVSILHKDFQKVVDKHSRTKTKAAEIEHAIRHHIDVELIDDPDLQASFAEALSKIFQDFTDNWNMIYEELEKLRERIIHASKEDTYGLHRKKQMPLFRSLKRELYGEKDLNDEEISVLVDLTQNIYLVVEPELKLTGFWESISARNQLKAQIQKTLLKPEYVKIPGMFNKRLPIVSRIMEIIEKNNDIILYAE